ncbi:hypothetical protein K1T71_000671 [Dendrolimus kikuchii]|uniref:Uncharacterized protein n=1 Tax=Dendrolimus kikuchii TaxID=765133 RepID=A0ACC1DJW4_9NEOP|nr:hypothetical protein K1T71_000671 [Dendrolimus kikuchii]
MSKTSTHSLPQRSSCINDPSTQCHICNIAVPKPFIVNHMKSSLHIYNVQIMDITLERSKDFIKANNLDIKSAAEETNDEFCDVCSLPMKHCDEIPMDRPLMDWTLN